MMEEFGGFYKIFCYIHYTKEEKREIEVPLAQQPNFPAALNPRRKEFLSTGVSKNETVIKKPFFFPLSAQLRFLLAGPFSGLLPSRPSTTHSSSSFTSSTSSAQLRRH